MFDKSGVDLLTSCAFLEHALPSVDRHGGGESFSTLSFTANQPVTFCSTLHRDFRTGQVLDNLLPVSHSFDFSCSLTARRPSQSPECLQQVIQHGVEVHRRIKEKFSLHTLAMDSLANRADKFCVLDKHAILLSRANSDVLSKWGLVDRHSTALRDGFTMHKLEYETAQLMRKRLAGLNSCQKFSILEDTSQKLPSLSKLISNPAKSWDFELDTFQKQAILCLERNQSVFVAAHTSAGKTVVAEYAVAMCRRRGSRAIYTSPVKALSNQKFYDFRRTLGNDVGLLTGDVKVATDSGFLVMTTEILYNMLCNSADSIRDLEVVIMDEVHYLNDAERGHVWEQIMIMLPKHVLLVMLSATVPNTLEFADWLGRVRGSEIHVVATDCRPVPLEHYLFTGLDGQATEKHLHMVVSQMGEFNVAGYKQAIIALSAPKSRKPPAEASETANSTGPNSLCQRGATDSNAGDSRGRHQKATGGKAHTPGRHNYMPAPGCFGRSGASSSIHDKRVKNLWLGVVRMLRERELMPAIAFGFSRSSLEVLAGHLSAVDLLDKIQKNEVQTFIRYSIKNRLKGSNAQLPSVRFIMELALRGIAVHHAGMLPVLKETVEMLFQRGLIRLLFATETFAMGVNMPARCVVFSTLEKYDGRQRRPLNPGEYTQMAGRAGRRGLDIAGTVIIIVDGIGRSVAANPSTVAGKLGLPTPETLMSMLMGRPTQLASQFKITYSMILHLHRTNWLSPQEIMRRSFMEAPALRRETFRKHCLSLLKTHLSATTKLLFSAGTTSSTSPANTVGALPRGDNPKGALFTAPVASSSAVPLGEPVLQVKCPTGGSQSHCVDEMTTYYQSCCTLRHLTASLSSLLALQPMGDVNRIFCPGRLLIIQLPCGSMPLKPKSCSTATANSALFSSSSQPNWLLPALVVDVSKANMPSGDAELQLSLLTWQPPDFQTDPLLVNSAASHPALTGYPGTVTSSGLSDENIDELALASEEDILCEGEDCWMSVTPFPPQLMPVFIPPSTEDAFSRLVLFPNLPFRCVVRLCDQLVNFKSPPSTGNNSTISERLNLAINRHRQEVAATEAGLKLLKSHNTSLAEDELSDLIGEVNQALFYMVRRLPAVNADHHQVDIGDSLGLPRVYGLPPAYPPTLAFNKLLKSKLHTEELNSIADEMRLLSDELTSPLIGGTSQPVDRRRLAPVTCPDLVAHFFLLHRTCRRRWAVKRLEKAFSDDRLHLNTEYLGRLHVLQELGFLDTASERGCLSVKGLVACELQQMEILLTQLLLDGLFTQLPPADVAALLSCFAFEARPSEYNKTKAQQPTACAAPLLSSGEPPGHLVLLKDDQQPADNPGSGTTIFYDLPPIPKHLNEPVIKMFQFAENLEQLQRRFCLADPTLDTRLNAALVNVTYAWATGQSFSTLVHLTDMQEGDLVRGLLRLDELLRHVCDACHQLGDKALALRMDEARGTIHRDLICAPSLYTSQDFVHEEAEHN